MSNYLAIATVTATLREIVQEAALAAIPGAYVTLHRPEHMNTNAPEQAGINLFLYQVIPNTALSNVDLPTRNVDGTLIQRPQAALDLYYLLSFQGSELMQEPQRLLGSTISALHANPILTADIISSTIEKTSYLAQSDLATQIERIKLAPLNLNLEELAKLWSVFYQIPYILSVAYYVSVVLIEAQVDVPVVKPVLERGINVKPEVSA